MTLIWKPAQVSTTLRRHEFERHDAATKFAAKKRWFSSEYLGSQYTESRNTVCNFKTCSDIFRQSGSRLHQWVNLHTEICTFSLCSGGLTPEHAFIPKDIIDHRSVEAFRKHAGEYTICSVRNKLNQCAVRFKREGRCVTF